MTTQNLGGRFTFPDTSMSATRIGFGAMQLPGPGVFGPPKDHAEAIAVLRDVIALGINHIDTSDFYGPHVANQLIKEALHPYPKDLVIVTKIGAKRGADKSWNPAYSKADVEGAVHDNLRNLGVDALDVVNLRLGAGGDAPFQEPLDALLEMKRKGLIKHLGASNVTPAQYATIRKSTDIVCVQNHYNVVHRADDAFIDALAKEGVAYVPFFPLGGFMPLQSETLEEVARQIGASSRQVALAWLLQRSANMLLIAGTSSRGHLRDNTAVADIRLPADALAKLDGLAAHSK
jgi:aryl-alcohol dehydrogenase-like predicted oxidoreductase